MHFALGLSSAAACRGCWVRLGAASATIRHVHAIQPHLQHLGLHSLLFKRVSLLQPHAEWLDTTGSRSACLDTDDRKSGHCCSSAPAAEPAVWAGTPCRTLLDTCQLLQTALSCPRRTLLTRQPTARGGVQAISTSHSCFMHYAARACGPSAQQDWPCQDSRPPAGCSRTRRAPG